MTKTLRKLRAKVSGTFVTDCPHCHKHFYGFHKFKTNVQVKTATGQLKTYRVLCHRCEKHIHLEETKTV